MSDQNNQTGQSSQNAPPGYLLGEMAATVRNIDQNVTAIRNELGDLTKRVSHVETELAGIIAERQVVMPEYQEFVKTVRAHMVDVDQWRNRVDGGVATAKGGGKILHIILTAIFTLALFIAGQISMDYRASITSRPPSSIVPH